jgi:hypothetical protein
MPRRPLTCLILAGLLVLAPLRTWATTVEAPDFDSLISQADYVVRATVKSVTSDWRESQGHRYIGTKVELEVHEVIKGTPPTPLVLDLVGGRVGAEELIIQGAPKFQLNEEAILFVHGNGTQIYPLVAMMHGVYPVFHDAKTGRELALRSNGMPLYHEEDVSLPMTQLSPVKVKNPAAQPMTAAAFTLQIRNHARRSAPQSREN